MGTTTREERPGRRAWLGDEVDRLIAWMRTKFADARLDDGAGEAAAVIRLLERRTSARCSFTGCSPALDGVDFRSAASPAVSLRARGVVALARAAG